MIIDPRKGDAEDDLSSPNARSLVAIAGGMLAEISPLKIAVALLLLVAAPALALGFAPLVLGAWLSSVSGRAQAITGLWSLMVIVALLALALLGWRYLFRLLESNFWSLNSLLVQPGYVACREILRHLLGGSAQDGRRWIAPMGAGLVIACVCAIVTWLVWPATRWTGLPADLIRPMRLVRPSLANATMLVALYAAAAALIWGATDGATEPPRDLDALDARDPDARTWRIAHVSDVHVVGERFGFRIECGRAGPQGNERYEVVLGKLAEIHAAEPLDILLFSGDMTDAGRSAEWAEFLERLNLHPELAAIALLLPGNHDLNIIDKANPARIELPWSSTKGLRQVRVLSAIEAVQGGRVTVIDPVGIEDALTLSDLLAPHRAKLGSFADTGPVIGARGIDAVWRSSFPQVLPPATPDGLGVLLLDSNAGTHFSFTNALGLLSARQAAGIERALAAWPEAGWVIAMHHHLVEYPRAAEKLSIRLGTALINGSWVVRQLERHAHRLIVMHGHRHVDWTGRCGSVRIVSAPSPVMNEPGCFFIHALQMRDGRLALCPPQRIDCAQA